MPQQPNLKGGGAGKMLLWPSVGAMVGDGVSSVGDLDLRKRLLRISWGFIVAVAMVLINFALPSPPATPYPIEVLSEGFEHLSLAEAQSRPKAAWQPVDPRQLSFPADAGREVWLHAKVPANPTGEKWVAEISTPYIRQLDFYLMDSDQTLQSASLVMDRPLANRQYNVVYHAFGFTPSSSQEQHLYVRAYSEVNVYLPLKIVTETAFHSDSIVRNTILGLLIGVFFGIVLYNLFICVSLRDRVYAYYCLYEIGILLLSTSANGQIQMLFPQAASAFAMDIRLMALSLAAVGIAFALFIQEFAALKYNDAQANRLVLPFIGLLLIMTIPIMIMPLHIMVNAVIISISLGVALLLLGTSLRAKTRREFYLFLSFVGLATCCGLTLATDNHLVPTSMLSQDMLSIGCIWQALFLSIALAERISVMEDERKVIIRTLKGDGPASELNNILGKTFSRTHSLAEMNVSIMFIDIVGFSQLSDILGPRKTFDHLARLMQDVTAIVKECHGNVDRSLGDGVLCIFGYGSSALRLQHHAQDAFNAARRIQEDIVSRYQNGALDGDYVLPVRIGIHVANVLIGDLGGKSRIDFTMVGSGVNFASRLETACSPFKIMLSEQCLNHLPRNAIKEQGFAEILVAVKHEKTLVKAYEFDPFSSDPERLQVVEMLHLDQLARKTEDSRHVIIKGQPVHLCCDLGVFNLLDFSNHGFRVMSDVYIGRNATLELTLLTFDTATNQALEALLLNKFFVEVRWSRKAKTGGYEHGLRISGLNEVQREKLFNLVAKLYARSDTALDGATDVSLAG